MQYQPGESGNPKGRPPGSGKVAQYRALLQSHADELIKQLIAQALAGDPAALKMCVDRLIPAYRLESLPVEFALPPGGKLVETGQAVLSAMSEGGLAPDQAVHIVQTLVGQAKLRELEELEQRIAALEAGANHGNP